MLWLTTEIQALALTAITIGVIHTIIGPDHYLPFVALAKAHRWALKRTLTITFLCGLGHSLGSVTLGIIGIALGFNLALLDSIETNRADVALYMLLAFGLGYFVYGLRQIWKSRSHEHVHVHADGTVHQHTHNHRDEHGHVHRSTDDSRFSPWMLFIIFVLGPCEALIPILMYPAAEHNYMGVFFVSACFVLATLICMLIMVSLVYRGAGRLLRFDLHEYSHMVSGLIILLCGAFVFAGF